MNNKTKLTGNIAEQIGTLMLMGFSEDDAERTVKALDLIQSSIKPENMKNKRVLSKRGRRAV